MSDHSDYFKEIGLTDKFLAVANDKVKKYEKLFQFEFGTAFISEYLDGEGQRIYESLCLFTEDHWCESERFLQEDNIDAVSLKHNVVHWKAHFTNYELNESTKDSKIVLDFQLTGEVRGKLKATAENCDYLARIIQELMVPNVANIN